MSICSIDDDYSREDYSITLLQARGCTRDINIINEEFKKRFDFEVLTKTSLEMYQGLLHALHDHLIKESARATRYRYNTLHLNDDRAEATGALNHLMRGNVRRYKTQSCDHKWTIQYTHKKEHPTGKTSPEKWFSFADAQSGFSVSNMRSIVNRATIRMSRCHLCTVALPIEGTSRDIFAHTGVIQYIYCAAYIHADVLVLLLNRTTTVSMALLHAIAMLFVVYESVDIIGSYLGESIVITCKGAKSKVPKRTRVVIDRYLLSLESVEKNDSPLLLDYVRYPNAPLPFDVYRQLVNSDRGIIANDMREEYPRMFLLEKIDNRLHLQ